LSQPARQGAPDRGPLDRAALDRGSGNQDRAALGGALRQSALDAVERAFHEEQARALATLIRVLGDFDLAEEAVADAFLIAVRRWPETGVPPNPAAWIVTTARNRAIDRLRRVRRLAEREPLLRQLAIDGAGAVTPMRLGAPDDDGSSGIVDDRLRLIFTCCHPVLAQEAQVALTLRTLGGLTTTEIARAFLVPEPTMAQRIVRAKKKIRDEQVPYLVPPAHELPERLGSVLAVVYLVFNEGYAATSGDHLVRHDLCDEAIRLGRLLAELMPDEPEVAGLLALLLFHDSRRETRIRPDGEPALLDEQDRSRWNREEIAEGERLLDRAVRTPRPGAYTLQAAIAAIHATAATANETDWAEIAALYEVLARVHPTPVVALNRAAALAMRDGPQVGLSILDELAEDPMLSGYHLYHSARADLLRRLDLKADSAAAYRRALNVATNPAERRFLERRLAEMSEAATRA
jgi:RNA polymerase sigma-70 factor (ECF subfamily)